MENLNHAEKIERITQAIAEKPDGILETLATQYGVPIQSVLECLPSGITRVDGRHFVDVLKDIAHWGDITFICHSKDAIIEFSGPLPQGEMGHGMYNLRGGAGGLSGHLRPENCAAIFFVSRMFMGMETRSIQFFNADGDTIFKIYVGRDRERRLKAVQVERFERLAIQFAKAAGNA